MKLLTATSATQGQRASDFAWCVEGELVTFSDVICGRDEREGPDGGCGCGRSFAGLNSNCATTTAMVRDLDGFTMAQLILAVRGMREATGWADYFGALDLEALVRDEAVEIAEEAARHPAGTVLEKRLAEICAREVRQGAGGPA